ncbi:MAG: sensor histidine kinase, partial [Opitutaceae bacterium]
QLKFILVGTTLGFLGGGTNFPYWYEIPIPPFGNGLVVVYLVSVTYAVIGLRLLEVNYVIIKGAVYFLVALGLAAVHPLVFAGLHFLAGYLVAPLWIWGMASIPLAMIALMLLPALRRSVDRVLERTLLKPYVTARDRLSVLAHEISGIKEEREMFYHAARTVSGSLGAFAAFYLKDELNLDCRLFAAAGVPDGFLVPEIIDSQDPLLNIVRLHRHPLLVDEIASLEGFDKSSAVATREKFRFEAVVPLNVDGVLIGMLGVGLRARNRVYSDLHLSLLDSVALQLGLQVRARQIERRANQAEKLISLGTLAAGLAHELRNPLVSIKTFSQLLEESADDKEFRREFSTTVLRDVSRIESIVENVAAFASDRKVDQSWIRIEEVVKAAFGIVNPSFHTNQVRCEFDYEDTPAIRGNHNQLTQVVINLMNNAVQAFRDAVDPCVTVSLRHRNTDPDNSVVELSIADNGPGIDPAIREKLFEPFTTTKDTGDRHTNAGMGLGLAIVKRIVEGHNGALRVESEPGVGTTLTVVLPCGGTPV